DNGDGTVTDNLTKLIWRQDINCCGGRRTWAPALTDCNSLADGSCGLTDGSVAGGWRLPSIKELQSLIGYANFNPALPSGHPFTGVQPNYYWSGTTYADRTDNAWGVYMLDGFVIYGNKTQRVFVWPVRK
ncbi:MAG: DUF1566 domain-containing protein, partial [Planctomycetes bacterium]|nr:DUF1566 domain-containing protein [Planctomycetota bacterium]